MLYIHKLNDLAPKTADVESVYLIRELKQKTPYPFTAERVGEYFSDFFWSDTDRLAMEQALVLIQPTIERVKQIAAEQNELHEPLNLQRAIQIIEEMLEPLQKNIAFAWEIQEWQKSFSSTFVPLFNAIPKLKTQEEKISANEKVNGLFQRVLRNNDFAFNAQDIVNEGEVSHITGLSESLARGFFFHVSLEEELKKVDFETIKTRIPAEKLAETERVQQQLETIKRGIERAYAANMRMVNWGLVMYAYVKWMMAGV
ncbi:hypothetical protein HYX14_05435 [Candidatus Woesearchaeota archaeon]|nr:hypothetical protein [Candidatus Woesearchaeota archaeon]